jgi:hypothetical protein
MPGFIHSIPIAVPEELTFVEPMISILPWFAPAYNAQLVTTARPDAEPGLLLGSEWPLSWLRTVETIPKYELEWLHLRRFSLDHAIATGAHAFANVQPGGDPPDAVAQTADGWQGVEATALTLQDLRQAHALFSALRQRLQASEPVAFGKLLGHVVYVWFDSPKSPADRPFRRSDEAALDALVEALAAYKPQPQKLYSAEDPPSDPMEPLPLHITDDGAKFYAVPLQGAAPSSMLFTIAGFEIALAHSVLLTAADAWAEVDRLVRKHDKAGVDTLLITAAGPDRHGTIYPIEEAVASLLKAYPIGLSKPPEHIKMLILHWWMTGQAITIYPTVEPLFAPQYTGMTPLHHPLSPPPEASTEGHDADGVGPTDSGPAVT